MIKDKGLRPQGTIVEFISIIKPQMETGVMGRKSNSTWENLGWLHSGSVILKPKEGFYRSWGSAQNEVRGVGWLHSTHSPRGMEAWLV